MTTAADVIEIRPILQRICGITKGVDNVMDLQTQNYRAMGTGHRTVIWKLYKKNKPKGDLLPEAPTLLGWLAYNDAFADALAIDLMTYTLYCPMTMLESGFNPSTLWIHNGWRPHYKTIKLGSTLKVGHLQETEQSCMNCPNFFQCYK